MYRQILQQQGGHGGHGGYSAPRPQLVKILVQRNQGGHGNGGHGGYSAGPQRIVKVSTVSDRFFFHNKIK